MESLERIIEEHEQLLISRGYDSGTLKNGFLKEDIIGDLKSKLAEAVLKMETEEQPVVFCLTTKGLFNDNMDMVTYHLFYRGDPEKTGLDLYKLEICWEQFVKKINLNTSYHLPSSREAFETLKKEQDMINRRNMQRQNVEERPALKGAQKKRGKKL